MEILLIWLRDVLINGFATSGLVPVWLRRTWYRLLGMKIPTSSGIYPRCWIGGRTLTLGENSWIYYNGFIDTAAPVTIGDNVCLSQNVTLVTAGHDVGPSRERLGPDHAKPIVIEDGCWIGIGATIVGGVTVRKGCVIAAGAFVVRSTKPDGFYAGYPARRIKDLDPDLPARVGPKHSWRSRDTWTSSHAAVPEPTEPVTG